MTRRSVMIDIIEKGLDPRKAHTSVGKDGSLVAPAPPVHHHVVHAPEAKVENPPVSETKTDEEVVLKSDTQDVDVEEKSDKKKNALKQLKSKKS